MTAMAEADTATTLAAMKVTGSRPIAQPVDHPTAPAQLAIAVRRPALDRRPSRMTSPGPRPPGDRPPD